ncbi:hypothetical protein BS47DRAFT_1340436 [Hydnum rufescens UP504]|uniref:Uncharacterized protein n=1 Tax=Hydnum rufescens UP504 TaxID=1448309 RepID=A0A9P6B5R6_9AGAM|nr:hypothetical protein BS47DRAFT_1340436 [Hydnum rufescens UP504]
MARRTEANENTEKWFKARDYWEQPPTVDRPAGLRIRQEAMLSGDSGEAATVQISRPQPPPKPKHQTNPPSDAVNCFRNVNDTQDLERIQIEDAVDAKLVAWKGGKENNLITPGQVEIHYMKAIGRVHPDKQCRFSIPPPLFFGGQSDVFVIARLHGYGAGAKDG